MIQDMLVGFLADEMKMKRRMKMMEHMESSCSARN